METFHAPQRQSPVGIVVMFFDTVQQYARAIWPVLLIWAFRFETKDWFWLLLSVAVFIMLIAVVAYLKYRNFTFYLDTANNEFVLTEGILNKTRTSIGLHKIQQVNIKQSLLQRIIGVHALEIDTAGSSGHEASIKAIDHTAALALKTRLLEGQQRAQEFMATIDADAPAPEQTQELLNMSTATLVKVGLTSNYVRSLGVMVAFFFTLYENFLRFSNQGYIDEGQFEAYLNKGLAVNAVLILLSLLFGAILLINLLRTVTRYFGYRILKENGALQLSFGLFSTKNTILRPERVQTIAITQNYFQKKLNLCEFKIKQAGSTEAENKKTAIEIPGCNACERDTILQLLLGHVPEKGLTLLPNFRKLVFAIFLSIVLPLCVFYGIAVMADGNLMQLGYIAPFYTLCVLMLLYFGFKNYKLFINAGSIVKQSGAWDITQEIVTPGKIQALSVSQLFWHKGANIGYLTIHTAAGDLRFELGQFDVIRDYVNLWLYEIESGDGNWM